MLILPFVSDFLRSYFKMRSSANLLLLLLVTTGLYRSTSGASTSLGTTKDNATDTEDILGEHVNEMSYSDIEEMLGNSNKSDKNGQFVVVNEESIDEELSEVGHSQNLTGLIVIIVILASGPILFLMTALFYCVVLAYEKYQKKHRNGGE